MKKIVNTTLYIYLPSIIVTFILKFTEVIEQIIFTSVIAALLLNVFNLIAALFLYYISINRSNQLFMLLNFGGMGVRVFFLLLGFALALIFLEIDDYAFILVFLIFYIISIYTEIKYFYKADQ
ncbi:MAG: hypothetical protein ABFS12_06215 [Bacteroidota bacterium]